MIKKKVFASSVLAMVCAGMTANVAARPQYASQFSVDCSTCHTSVFGGGELKAAARDAYLKGGVMPGLSDFVKSTQMIQTLATINTKPVISPIALEWDAEAGQALSIPLSVTDAEQDSFQIAGKLPSGSSLSTEYTASNGLPTVDFQWTPTDTQVNKVYTIKFTAKETATSKKLSSLPITAKVRVWPAGDRDQAYISKFIVSTSKWAGDSLMVKGKVIFNKLVTAAEKAVLLNRTDWTVNITQGTTGTGTGTAISSLQPITLDKGGNWTLSNISLIAPFSCNITVEFEGKLAARKITGAPTSCLK
jgi:hypothetical protein